MKLKSPVYLLVLLFNFIIFSSLAYSQSAPLTLKESIKIAKNNSHQVGSARKKIVASEAKVGQAFSGYLPQLSIEGVYGKSYQQPPTYYITDPYTGNSYAVNITPNEIADVSSWRLKWSQALYTGGKLSNTLGIAELDREIKKEQLKQVENDITYNVISAYDAVIKAKRAVALAEEAFSLANDHKNQANSLLKAGVVTRADTLRAEVAVASAEHNLTIAKNALAKAKNAFNSLLGRKLNEEVILSEDNFKLKDAPTPKYEELLDTAYRNRPDWISFKFAKEAAGKYVCIAISDFLPSFALVGTYGYDYTNYPEEGPENNTRAWTAFLSGTWKLFDGFGTPQRVKEALAQREALEEDENALKDMIAIEVKDALDSLNASLDSMRSSTKALDLAKENHRLAQLRYSSQAGTNIEVIDAETALSQAKLNKMFAEFDHEQAKAKINKACGVEIFKIAN